MLCLVCASHSIVHLSNEIQIRVTTPQTDEKLFSSRDQQLVSSPMSLFADQQSGNLNIRYVVKVVKQSKQKFTALVFR